MNNTKQYLDQQEAKQLQNKIVAFMKYFKIGNLLHRNESGSCVAYLRSLCSA
ncbi:MAG: hypothetical protein KJ804_00430 [Proteobacteria bacterium]|nr:hypothetical protein [Pseudomonadota bacterium]MBU1056772.1 hypothetical protein [Pseudomonadota bacterium]